MTTVDKAAIFAADDLPTEDVDVPEWGGVLTVRTMTCGEQDEMFVDLADKRKGGKQVDIKGFRARLVQLTVVNGDGSLLFEKDDIPQLQKKSSLVMERIAEVAMRINGLTSSDVEAVAGNSSMTEPSGSGTS